MLPPPTVGDQIQAQVGTWTNSPTGFTYEWQHSTNGTGSWTDTVDVTGSGSRSDFIVPTAETGFFLSCLVTASNVSGSSTAQRSQVVGPIFGGALTGYWGIAMLIPQVINLPAVVTINTTDCDT